MIELDAFYYEYDYYLFPADVTDVDGLKRYVCRNGTSVHVRKLGQDKCRPPYFADNSVVDSVIENIDTRFVFPVRVFLMPAGNGGKAVLFLLQI